MKRTFLIGDTHFGHKNILKYEPVARPFKDINEHDDALIERWNSKVGPDDIVWHVGDVLFGADSFPLLGRLNGIKNLVLGNHDTYPLEEYQKYFKEIVGATSLRGCIVTHYPVHESQFFRYKGNIHGHVHSKSLQDQRYINVSAEAIDLTPVLLDTVISKLDKYMGSLTQPDTEGSNYA